MLSERITKLVSENPGKTAGELAELCPDLKQAQVVSTLTHCIKKKYITRKRVASTRFPNVGIWTFYA